MVKIPKTEFIIWMDSRGLSARTVREYVNYLNKFLNYNAFDQKAIDGFVMANKNNVARAFLRILKEFLLRNPSESGYTEEEERQLRQVNIPRLRQGKRKKPIVITEEKVLKIEECMKSEGAKLLLLLSFYCGLRVNELLNIKKDDFNWNDWRENQEENGVLRLPERKGGKADYVPVKSEIMKRLRNWINGAYLPETFNPNLPLFPIKYSKWYRILKTAGREAIDFHVNPHLLRHSIATHLLEKGFDINEVKEFLSHEDIGTTQIYAHVSKRKIFDKYKINLV